MHGVFVVTNHASSANLYFRCACALKVIYIILCVLCSAANKKQKLENFAQVKMWYLQQQCNHDTLTPLMGLQGGKKKTLYDQLSSLFPHKEEDGGYHSNTFDALSQECCHFEGNL